MRALVVVLWLAAWPVCGHADPTAREVLQACIERAEPDSSGASELEAACPGLTAALAQLDMLDHLPMEWEDNLQVGALEDLLVLHDAYQGPSPPRPNRQSLQAVLDKLAKDSQARPQSLWTRIKNWLREIWQPPGDEAPSWLATVLEKLSSAAVLIELFAYLAVAAVIALAIGIVIAELRSAGLLKAREKIARNTARSESIVDAADATLADLDGIAPANRPAFLLRMLVSLLVRSGQLQTERALTHRELSSRAKFNRDPDRERFEQLARVAEELHYGAGVARIDMAAQRHESALTAARALYTELRAAIRERT